MRRLSEVTRCGAGLGGSPKFTNLRLPVGSGFLLASLAANRTFTGIGYDPGRRVNHTGKHSRAAEVAIYAFVEGPARKGPNSHSQHMRAHPCGCTSIDSASWF